MSTKYNKELLREAVANSLSMAGVVRHLGLQLAGGNLSHIKKKIDLFEIDTSHFTGQGHMRGKVSNNRRTPEEILVVLPEGSYRAKTPQLRRALIESGVLQSCGECGIMDVWNGKKLQLHVDHIDGNWLNNLLENLRFLCPNCHSQQEETNKPWKNS